MVTGGFIAAADPHTDLPYTSTAFWMHCGVNDEGVGESHNDLVPRGQVKPGHVTRTLKWDSWNKKHGKLTALHFFSVSLLSFI